MHELNCADVATRQLVGELAPHGNPSYLRWALNPTGPKPTAWYQGMPSEQLDCPECAAKGTVTASSNPTLPGLLTLTTRCGCNVAAVRAAFEAEAPRAFVRAEDELVPLPEAGVQALASRAATGAFVKLDHAKVVLKTLGELHAIMGKGTFTRVLSASGQTHMLVFRFESAATHNSKRHKEFRQVHALRNLDGVVSYELGLPQGELPLVGLDQLALRPLAQVVVSEGEKARAAGEVLLPEFVHVSSIGGSGAAHKTDWSQLRDRVTYVVPDNDPAEANGKLSAGQKYAMRAAARMLKAGAAAVRIAEWPAGTSAKHDLADGLPKGMDAEAAGAWLRGTVEAEWDAVKAHLGGAVVNASLPPLRQPDGWLAWSQQLYAAAEEALQQVAPKGWQFRYRVLCGLHHAFGSNCLPLYEGWLKQHGKDHKHKYGEVERRLQALDKEPVANPMQLADLFRTANAHSKRRPGANPWRADEDAYAKAHVAAMAERLRKVKHEGKLQIAVQRRLPDGSYELEYESEKTAESMLMTERVPQTTGKNTVRMTDVFHLWQRSQWATTLHAVFRPGEALSKDELNTYLGLRALPDPTAGTYARFKAHVNRVGAENNDGGWLWNAIAYRLQNPGVPMKNVLCLTGPQGSGKSTISEVLGMLCNPYDQLVIDPENLVGNFNAAVADKLVVRAEDMTLSRRPEWEEKLRSYATSERVTVTNKGSESRSVRNCMWVVLTSNNMALNVRRGERRFAMYHISDPMAHDVAARDLGFALLMLELKQGGLHALMADLLTHEIPADFMPGVVPRTPLYTELVGASATASPLTRWWLEIMDRAYVGESQKHVCEYTAAARQAGHPAGDWTGWREPVLKDTLYDMYKLWCESDGSRTRGSVPSKEGFSKGLLKLLPGISDDTMKRLKIRTGGPASEDRQRQYFVAPPYAECVSYLDTEHGIVVEAAMPEGSPTHDNDHLARG